MKFEEKTITADLVIVGGGYPGLCAALQAAREGVDVVLINDRGYLGGNASAEINIMCGGAPDCNPLNINSREGGIVDELRVETAYRSATHNRFIKDTVFLDAVHKEKKHLRLFMNTCIDACETDENHRIRSVSGTQNTTETRFTFIAPLFMDDTGDGTLGALSGADFMIGREARSTFGERIAPEEADSFVIPSTLTFYSHDTGHPVEYVAPDFAADIPKSGALRHRTIPHDNFNFQWYYEGDGAMDQVKDQEEIIEKHQALVYGIWDYIKNSGEYPEAKNYDLDFVSSIPGVREYRRLCGDKILIESDLIEQREYEDGVGFGGWNIDLHAIHGFFDDDLYNRHIYFRGVYQIPYRCGYSRNVPNLFMCGRCMSTSHVAFGSTRVIATLSTLGQALGMAAALCKEYGIEPRGVYESHREELRQRLLREDQYIPGVKNEDPLDLARKARVTASSEQILRIDRMTEILPMGEGLALELPIAADAKALILTGLADADTELAYTIYKPAKGYNFGPDEVLRTGSVRVSGSDTAQEIAIPLDSVPKGSYYFIDLTANDHLRFHAGPEPMLTTVMYCRHRNAQSNVWDYGAMKMMEYSYARAVNCLCYRFDCEQHVYAPENVINGYNRAYCAPNLWMSDCADESPELRLNWDTPQTLSMLQVTFGVDTSLKIYRYAGRILKYLSIDFDVYGIRNGNETLLASIRGNHSKRRRLFFEKGLYESVRFVFLKNHGRQVAVQEIRAET